ncbi:MAG: hypothetical protein V4537_10905 [Pseudomonadota bacterium]
MASEIGWRIYVHNARNAIAEELGEAMGQASERERIERCYLQRLDALAAVVERGAETGRLPPTGSPGSPIMRSWSRGVWTSVVGSETAAHLGRDELDNLSGAYEFVEMIARHSERELELWSAIFTIVGPGRSIDPGEASSLRATIAAARMESNLITLASVRLRQTVIAFNLDYSRDAEQPYVENDVTTADICKPAFLPVPAAYGVAPLDGSSDRARATAISRDNVGLRQNVQRR